MPQRKATTHLLWSQCPLSKWHRQASHQGPLGKHKETTAPCTRLLAGGFPLCIVAICIKKCSLPSQQPTSAGRWHIRVGSNLKHVHTFGCPVFALQNVLASVSQLPRWSSGAHLGFNLGPSPMHARKVYLILNLVTGCVSPQYHCRFDDFFEMTCHDAPEFLEPSAGTNKLIWIVQRLPFSRCQCQISTALCIWRRYLMRNLKL
jgi:hypothetical protein